MIQETPSLGQTQIVKHIQSKGKETRSDDFVLEKSIFNNIFEKDIRRVFIYKKAERLAKAIHLIVPAFADSLSLRNRIDGIAVGLVDAAMLPPATARTALSRELLTLSSMLAIARTGGMLSSMNADMIANEARILLHEVAVYEEPRLFLDDATTLSTIAKDAAKQHSEKEHVIARVNPVRAHRSQMQDKGHTKDMSNESIKDRTTVILSVLKNKKKASIKDISTIIRGVSEKTIQRELSALINSGVVHKEGERRWSVYSLV